MRLFCAPESDDVQTNDIWELLKLTAIGLVSAVGGGGLVRALGQNRNESWKQLDERNTMLANRIDAMVEREVLQATISGENRARIEFLEDRVHELTDVAQTSILERVKVERELRAMQVKLDDAIKERDELRRTAVENRQRILHLEDKIADLRAKQGVDTVANTAAVAENTLATQANTEARSDG
jgi:hypothetical protein